MSFAPLFVSLVWIGEACRAVWQCFSLRDTNSCNPQHPNQHLLLETWALANLYIYIHTYVCIYICIYTYLFICICIYIYKDVKLYCLLKRSKHMYMPTNTRQVTWIRESKRWCAGQSHAVIGMIVPHLRRPANVGCPAWVMGHLLLRLLPY
jgi:hypothetical protein